MGASKGIIIEGIPGSGKTSTIRQIQRLPAFLQREATTLLLLGEEITQRTLELRTQEGSLSAEDHQQLLDELITPLEQKQERFLKRGWSGGESRFQFLYLLERFHLTHATYYPYLQDWDYSAIEERLKKLSAKGCLFVMDPAVMRYRIIESRPYPAWRRYLARYGKNDEEIVEHYVRQQEAMLQRAHTSGLDWLILDTTEANWSIVASKVWKHWVS